MECYFIILCHEVTKPPLLLLLVIRYHLRFLRYIRQLHAAPLSLPPGFSSRLDHHLHQRNFCIGWNMLRIGRMRDGAGSECPPLLIEVPRYCNPFSTTVPIVVRIINLSPLDLRCDASASRTKRMSFSSCFPALNYQSSGWWHSGLYTTTAAALLAVAFFCQEPAINNMDPETPQ